MPSSRYGTVFFDELKRYLFEFIDVSMLSFL